MKALQFDLGSPQAERFLALLKPLLDHAGPFENARLLQDWDGVYRDDSRAATLFERFYRASSRRSSAAVRASGPNRRARGTASQAGWAGRS